MGRVPAQRLTRDQFLEAFGRQWKADQHVSLIGPVGRGKTYTARQILSQRPGRSLVLAPKGPDSTMTGFGHHLVRWPPGPFCPRPKNGVWRLLLQPPVKQVKHLPAMREHFRKALEQVFRQGNWTLYVDELQVISDPRMMGLGKLVESLLVMGRSRKISVVSSIQVPRWAPRAAYDQASHVLMWRQRDKPALIRIREISGVDTVEVEGIVKTLEFHEFLWVDGVRDMLFIVSKD